MTEQRFKLSVVTADYLGCTCAVKVKDAHTVECVSRMRQTLDLKTVELVYGPAPKPIRITE